MHHSLTSTAVMLSCLLTACSGDDLPRVDGDSPPCSGVCGGDADGGDVDVDARDPACPVAATWVTNVSGSVVDEADAALAAVKVQLCIREAINDRLLCLSPVDSQANGSFDAPVSTAARCATSIVTRVLLPLTDRAVTYCDLPLPTADGSLELTTPFILHATTPASTPPLGVTSSVHTVSFAGGLEVDVIPDEFFGDYDLLAGSSLDPTMSGSCIVDAGPALVGLFAFSPESDVSGNGFPFRLQNNLGLAADTALDLWVLGGLGCHVGGTLIHEGQWQRYGTGSVSSTGTDITGDPLPCLGFWGLSLR